jgi:hypothetical protein
MGLLIDRFLDSDGYSPAEEQLKLAHHRQMMEEEYKMRQNLANEKVKQSLINDPVNRDQVLAGLSRSAMTDKVAARMPESATFEKAITAIPEDDPRRKMYEQLAVDLPSLLENSGYGTDPRGTILAEVSRRSAEIRPEVYKYIQKNSGWFGKAVQSEPGYEEWEKKNPGFSDPVENAVWGVGQQLASIPVLAGAARYGATKPMLAKGLQFVGGFLNMAPPVGAGLLAKVVGAGLMGVAAFGMMDAIRKKSAKSGHELSFPEELVLGLGTFGGLNLLAKAGGRAYAARGTRLAMEKAGATKGLGSFSANEPWAKTEYPMSQGAEARVKDIAEGRRPANELEPPLPGESKADWADRVRAEEVRKGMLSKQKDDLDAFLKLTPEDEIALANPGLTQKERDAILSNRKKLGTEAYDAFHAENNRQLTESIGIRAKQFADEGLPMSAAVAKATSLLSPSAEEQVANMKYLRKFLSPKELSSMNPSEIAELAYAHKLNAGRTRTIPIEEWVGTNNMLPVPYGKYGTSLTPVKPVAGVPAIRYPQSKFTDMFAAAGKPLPWDLGNNSIPVIVQGDPFAVWPKQGERIVATVVKEAENVVKPAVIDTAESLNKTLRTEMGYVDPKMKAFNKDAAYVLNTIADEGAAILANGKDVANQIAALQIKGENGMLNVLDKHGMLDSYTNKDVPFRSAMRALKEKLQAQVPNMEKAEIEAAKTIDDVAMVTEASPKGQRKVATKKKVDAEKAAKEEEAAPYKLAAMDLIRKLGGLRMKPTAAELKDPEIKQLYKTVQEGKKAGYLTATLITAGLGLSIATPEKSEASVGTSVVKAVATDVAKSTMKAVDDQVAGIYAAGGGPAVIADDGLSMKSWMNSILHAPSDYKIFQNTVVKWWDKIASLGTRGDYHMHAVDTKTGARLPYGIGVEANYRQQVANSNTVAGLQVVNNILKKFNIQSDVRGVADFFEPLRAKYHTKVDLEYPYWQGQVDMYEKILAGKFKGEHETGFKGLSSTLRENKGDLSKLSAEDRDLYNKVIGKRDEAMETLKSLEPTIEAFKSEYDQYARKAATKWSSARVALACDGYGMESGNNWLRPLLTQNELAAVDRLNALNKDYAARMVEGGHQIITGSYIHHPSHPYSDYQNDLKHLRTFTADSEQAMRLVHFYHRGSSSRLMMPDVSYIMSKYIPDAEKRIQISDMWKMGKPGGWDFIRKQMEDAGGYEGARKLIDDVRKAFDPVDMGEPGRWLNRYAAFEVARLLTLSPSVSFKHALKLMGNWSVFPVEISTKASAMNIDLQTRQYALDVAGSAFKGKDQVADLGRALTHMHHSYSFISDMAPFDVPIAVYDRYVTKLNEFGSSLVNAVERFDRGQTFISAMLMANKRGMTPEQAVFGLMDSVLKVNFLTGPNNPRWLKDPFIRTMLLFQGTPFRILEQRAMLGYHGSKDLIRVLGQLRADVKQGEARFKWHMLNDELTRSKDIFGNSYSAQFLKQLMTIGTVITTGKYVFDSEMWKHTVHIPGLQLGQTGAQLGVNPLVSAVYRTASGDNITTENPDEFWLSRFFNTWLGKNYKGTPAILQKMARLSDNDIPAIYKEHKLNYLFGVPRIADE